MCVCMYVCLCGCVCMYVCMYVCGALCAVWCVPAKLRLKLGAVTLSEVETRGAVCATGALSSSCCFLGEGLFVKVSV